MGQEPVVIIGAGLAGLAATLSLSSFGQRVILLEKEAQVGGKMRTQRVGGKAIDAGPTVLTMKWVFDQLLAQCGTALDDEIELQKADTLARHAWDASGHFDLFADVEKSEEEIAKVFSSKDAAGYRRFCNDAKSVFETLKDTYMAAPCPSPTQLAQRVGFLNMSSLLALKPFQTLHNNLQRYFRDPRLQQLYGRYATYVGSSPYLSPATLMLIAHVEQDGVWLVKGGIHRLARAMAALAQRQGAEIRTNTDVRSIEIAPGSVKRVFLNEDETIDAKAIVYCGDASRLAGHFLKGRSSRIAPVAPKERSLSAITWTAAARASGFDLKRHNVFFSGDYRTEFDQLFSRRQPPLDPTVYICAQERETEQEPARGEEEAVLCLINAPAFGDVRTLDEKEMSTCLKSMQTRLKACGLTLEWDDGAAKASQPADFEALFPGSGGALYGRASHGWTASFARPGAKTRLPGLYLAGGSVHPGAGVPMATLSGMLAAEQIMKDRDLT